MGMDVTSSSTPRKASQVCRLCHKRKKACDKRLPTCGYCLKRGMICQYDDGGSPRSRAPADAAMTSVLAVRSAMLSVFGSSRSSLVQSRNAESQVSLDSGRRVTLAGTLHEQVTNIIQALNLSFEDISARYFQDCHPSFQIIAPQLLQETIRASTTPAADISVLILALCLVTVESPGDDLYVAARMLFAAIQSTTSASIALLQTALLVSSYEYARGWLDAASISVAQCVRMGYSLGINKYPFQSSHEITTKNLTAVQSWNLWWGVVMLDSIILSEADSNVQQPPAGYLTRDTHMPFDLTLEADCINLAPRTVGTFEVQSTSDFDRQAQAVFLLRRVRQAIHTWGELSELGGIDMGIQRFLMSITTECTNTHSQALHSACAAIAVRSLFILHQHILTNDKCQEILPDTTMQVLKQRSQAALSTAAKMVIDAAADHSHSTTMIMHALPFCCRKNLQDAKRVASSLNNGDCTPEDLQHVALVEKALDRRWGSYTRE